MTEILLLALGLGVGAAVGVVYACRRLAGKDAMSEAVRAVVLNGPGPWRPPK